MSELFDAGDPSPVSVQRADAQSPFVLICDHAGDAIPARLARLGLGEHESSRHITWDIGALGVAQGLSAALHAPLIWQSYSRLVVDCNRPRGHPELVIARSEATDIPGNLQLDQPAIDTRVTAIHQPYHDAIASLLDQRKEAGQQTVLVSVHSFTPVYLQRSRPWHLGLLYGDDRRLADGLFDYFANDQEVCLGDNQPYKVDDKDHSVPEHAFKRDLANILLEIRQDLITTDTGQQAWATRLAAGLRHAFRRLTAASA